MSIIFRFGYVMLIALWFIGCSDSSDNEHIVDIDSKYPYMKVGIASFETDGDVYISQEEKDVIIEYFAGIRTLFNIKYFEDEIRKNWDTFNGLDEGKIQTIKAGKNEYVGAFKDNNSEDNQTDGIPDGGCYQINSQSPIWPCGAFTGTNKHLGIHYFLSEEDQTADAYKNLKHYNDKFAQKKFKDVLDRDRMIELLQKVEYNVRFTKKNIGSAYEQAVRGPYRYLMDLDDPSLKYDRQIYFPNKNWVTDNFGGTKWGLVMHGIMHNLGFSHYLPTGFGSWGQEISPVTAVAQYVSWEYPKLKSKAGIYGNSEIQQMYQEILNEYKRRYSNL